MTAAARNPPNSELYSHISIAKVAELFDQGFSHRKIGKLLGMGPCSVGSRLRKAGKRPPPPARVTVPQLKECRADPAWEGRHGMKDLVVCRECGELKAVLDAPGEHGHLRKHKMTGDDYRRKYAGARLINFGVSVRLAARQGRSITIQELMEDFAAMRLTPDELKAFRQDHEWEERKGITDFVACRLCGLKSRTSLWAHLAKVHSESYVSYRKQFWKAPVIPLRLKKKKNEDQLPRSAKLRRQLRPFLKGGPGRKKLAREKTRDFQLGRMVETQIPRATRALAALAELPSGDRHSLEAIKSKLLEHGFSEREAELAQFERKPLKLARQFVADREDKTFDAVAKADQRYRRQ